MENRIKKNKERKCCEKAAGLLARPCENYSMSLKKK